MGMCENKSFTEKQIIISDNIPIPMDITNKVIKSICKIIIKNNGVISYGTGFFMKISDKKNILLQITMLFL